MPTTREAVLSALHAVLQAQAAPVLRSRTSPCSREVRRACGRVTEGLNRSAKIFVLQEGARQRKRLTDSTILTSRP